MEVRYESGPPDTYLLPLAVTLGEQQKQLRHSAPNAAIAPVVSRGTAGLLHDAVFDDAACPDLLALIENDERDPCAPRRHPRRARYRVSETSSGHAETPLAVRRGSAEQSNTSILYGDRFILKLFRRQEPGINPECEIERYLTEKVGFDTFLPSLARSNTPPRTSGQPSTLAMLQGLVANEGDGWKWTLEELDRYYEICAPAGHFPRARAPKWTARWDLLKIRHRSSRETT